MSKLREAYASGRPYFQHHYEPMPACASRFGARVAIEGFQVKALELSKAGEVEQAAAMYDEAALRWEALGGYSDCASDARAAARILRRGAR